MRTQEYLVWLALREEVMNTLEFLQNALYDHRLGLPEIAEGSPEFKTGYLTAILSIKKMLENSPAFDQILEADLISDISKN